MQGLRQTAVFGARIAVIAFGVIQAAIGNCNALANTRDALVIYRAGVAIITTAGYVSVQAPFRCITMERSAVVSIFAQGIQRGILATSLNVADIYRAIDAVVARTFVDLPIAIVVDTVAGFQTTICTRILAAIAGMSVQLFETIGARLKAALLVLTNPREGVVLRETGKAALTAIFGVGFEVGT